MTVIAPRSAPLATPPPSTEPSPPARVGVVFVHGIGGQLPGETLLDWSRPLIKALGEWRTAHGLPPDPVVESAVDFSGATLPTIEIDVPAAPAGPTDEPAAPQRWLLTEAWWASRVRPPSLGTMTGWLRDDFGRVVEGIRAGYNARARAEARRRKLVRLTGDFARLHAAGFDTRPWRWIDRLDRLQARLLSLALGVAWLLGFLVLLPYAALRSLPIPGFRDAVVLRQLDSFLVDWFGDMRILLHDPAQAANIRARLSSAVSELVARRCTEIVVVAHSGGAVVSFTTLSDPRWAPLPVTKLVTLGQGLDLAWRLENAWHGLPPGDRLIPRFDALYPTLRWVDFWASFDPAPGGPLDAPPGVGAAPDDRPIRNRMSLTEDHGTYWDNDEEFVIPLLRELDTPSGPASRSRFFSDRASELVRVERRRQRVGVLAAWRWVCLVAALAAVGGAALHAAVAGGDRLRRLGETASTVFGAIPGTGVIGGPIDWLAGLARWPAWLPTLGEWVLGVLVVAVGFVVLGRIGIARWNAWDLRERWLGRSEPPRPLERQTVWLEAALLGAAAVVLAAAVAVT
ncbi:MAG TPA: hypothetical protein VIV06_00890 [Candidatus Limnocylindrales bacterium]